MLKCFSFKFFGIYLFILNLMKVYAKYLQLSVQSKYYSGVSTRKFNGIFEKEYIDCVFKIFFIFICLLCIMQILYMNCEGFYFYSNSFLGISTGKNPCFIFGELYFLSFQGFGFMAMTQERSLFTKRPEYALADNLKPEKNTTHTTLTILKSIQLKLISIPCYEKHC